MMFKENPMENVEQFYKVSEVVKYQFDIIIVANHIRVWSKQGIVILNWWKMEK